jgi:hypothetical protein
LELEAITGGKSALGQKADILQCDRNVRLDPPSLDGKADPKIAPPRSRIPYWKGLCAESEEKREPVSDIDTAMVDSLKALDPNRPIREADMIGPHFAP